MQVKKPHACTINVLFNVLQSIDSTVATHGLTPFFSPTGGESISLLVSQDGMLTVQSY